MKHTRNGVVAMLWPVSLDGFTMKPVAHFFDYSDAAEFARENDGYVAEPIYDHLSRELRSGELGLVDVEHLKPRGNTNRIAA